VPHDLARATRMSPSLQLGVCSMLLDMKLYWPVCAKSKEVARWRARAGP